MHLFHCWKRSCDDFEALEGVSTIKGPSKGNMGTATLTFKELCVQSIKFENLVRLILLFGYTVCVRVCVYFFFFNLLFRMGLIHHGGISDINTALQINGSLTGPAADVDTRLSPWQLRTRRRIHRLTERPRQWISDGSGVKLWGSPKWVPSPPVPRFRPSLSVTFLYEVELKVYCLPFVWELPYKMVWSNRMCESPGVRML